MLKRKKRLKITMRKTKRVLDNFIVLEETMKMYKKSILFVLTEWISLRNRVKNMKKCHLTQNRHKSRFGLFKDNFHKKRLIMLISCLFNDP